MAKTLDKIVDSICKPVVASLPFFLTCSVLLLPHVISGFFNDVADGFVVNRFSYSIYVLLFNTAEVVALAYLLCVLLSGMKWPVLKVLLYAFIFTVFGINMFLRASFGTLFTENIMLLVVETTPKETQEFFQTFAFRPVSQMVFVILLVLILLLVAIEKWYQKRAAVLWPKAVREVFAVFILSILCISVIETTHFVNGFRNTTLSAFENFCDTPKESRIDYIRRMICNAYFLFLWNDESQSAVVATENALSESSSPVADDSLSIVVVIGESFIKSHASVYGYPQNTMPLMAKEQAQGRLILFDNVVTTSDRTSIALRNFFSFNSVGDNERWLGSPFFPALFKASGYDVYFWDNQYDKNTSKSFDFTLNAYLHHPTVSQLSYDAGNERSFTYDADLIDDFAKSCQQPLSRHDKNTLYMFHLMGQHFDTEERYPHTAAFCHFTADSIKLQADYLTQAKKAEIASYDNAVYYNDYVLGKIVSLYKDRDAILLFFSDHGEHIYDVSDVAGRIKPISKMTPAEIPYYYDIPLMFWISDKYRRRHPDMVSLFDGCKHKPLMSDNLCHLLAYIAHVNTKWYRPERNVLSSDYQCPPRIIENTVNYDKTTTNNP